MELWDQWGPSAAGPSSLLLLLHRLFAGCQHQHLGSACVSASSAGGFTTGVPPHPSKLTLGPTDITVIVIYFITVVVVGIWVSAPLTRSSTGCGSLGLVKPVGRRFYLPHTTPVQNWTLSYLSANANVAHQHKPCPSRPSCLVVFQTNQSQHCWRVLPGWSLHDLVSGKPLNVTAVICDRV